MPLVQKPSSTIWLSMETRLQFRTNSLVIGLDRILPSVEASISPHPHPLLQNPAQIKNSKTDHIPPTPSLENSSWIGGLNLIYSFLSPHISNSSHLLTAILNIRGNLRLNRSTAHHGSIQNLVLVAFPTFSKMYLLNRLQSATMDFHASTPSALLITLDHPLWSVPNRLIFHKLASTFPKKQSQIPSKALLKYSDIFYT